MNKNKEIISVSLVTVMIFFISFILLFNDVMNYFIVFITITAILFGYLCYIVFSNKDEKTIYDRKIKKILKTYDSILVYSDYNYDVSKQNVIFLKNFDSLLAAREELDTTMIYIEEKESNIFMVKDNKELLVYIFKLNDDVESPFEYKLKDSIEKKQEKKKKTKKNVLDDLEKTTIIQLKNDKVYKVSPVRK
jgi:hypothetical protein